MGYLSYFLPKAKSNGYFDGARINLIDMSTKGYEAISHSANAVYTGAKVGAQLIFGCAAFDYSSGKIVSSYAMKGLMPFATPSLANKAIDFAFNTLVTNPAAVLAATISSVVALHPEDAMSCVKSTGKSICKTLETTSCAAMFAVNAAGGSLLYMLETAESIENYIESCLIGNMFDTLTL